MAVDFLNISTGSGTTGTGINLKQIVKTNVVINQAIEIPITETLDFKIVGIANVLKYVPGGTNEITTLNTYDNSEDGSFLPNSNIIFDNTMHLRTSFELFTTSQNLGTGKMFVTEINRDAYKSVEGIEVA